MIFQLEDRVRVVCEPAEDDAASDSPPVGEIVTITQRWDTHPSFQHDWEVEDEHGDVYWVKEYMLESATPGIADELLHILGA